MRGKITDTSFKELKAIKNPFWLVRAMSFACRGKLAELEVSLPFSGCPEMASDSLQQWRKVLGALICTELSPGLLVFPICKAHDFISSLKVRLLKPLPHIILKILFGCLMAFLSQEPLGELPKSPCWREEKKRKSGGQVLSSALSLASQ